MTKETYKEARLRLLKELASRGWTVKTDLKVLIAVSTTIGPELGYPEFRVKLYFRPQSVYLHNHSMHLENIRDMAIDTFLAAVIYWVQAQGNNPYVYR